MIKARKKIQLYTYKSLLNEGDITVEITLPQQFSFLFWKEKMKKRKVYFFNDIKHSKL